MICYSVHFLCLHSSHFPSLFGSTFSWLPHIYSISLHALILYHYHFLLQSFQCSLFMSFWLLYSDWFPRFSFFTSPITHSPRTTVERFADLGDSMSPLQPWGVHWSGQASERRPHRAAAAGGETTGGLRLHWERPAAAGSNGGWGQVWKLMIIYWCCLSWKTVLIELCISS